MGILICGARIPPSLELGILRELLFSFEVWQLMARQQMQADVADGCTRSMNDKIRRDRIGARKVLVRLGWMGERGLRWSKVFEVKNSTSKSP